MPSPLRRRAHAGRGPFELGLLAGAAAVLLALPVPSRAGISITPLTPVPELKHRCPGEEPDEFCRTRVAMPSVIAGPGAESPVTRALRAAYPDWTVQFGGAALTGEIDITTFQAHLCDPYTLPPGWRSGDPLPDRHEAHCMHGAQLEMTFKPTLDDFELRDTLLPGGTFYWLQLVASAGSYCVSWTGSRVDRTVGPYYYDPGELQHIHDVGRPEFWFFDAPQDGCRAHDDTCGGRCPEKDGEYWQRDYSTYLALGTPGAAGTGTMLLFEGIHWGYQAACVPGPGTFATVLAAAAIVTLPRQRSWRRAR